MSTYEEDLEATGRVVARLVSLWKLQNRKDCTIQLTVLVDEYLTLVTIEENWSEVSSKTTTTKEAFEALTKDLQTGAEERIASMEAEVERVRALVRST